MKKDEAISPYHVDVLDGIRAISVIIVLIFHFWQQTWIFPVIKTPFLKFIGVSQISFTSFARVGYLFVDMMILISGFLLFLPIARNILLNEPLVPWGKYFKKRAVRILPSYLLCITILFAYELINGGYGQPIDWTRALSDMFLHLTFMHTWTVNSYLATKLNVVLWTLAVEVWFYILFPLLASIIKRNKKDKSAVRPILRSLMLSAVMIAASLLYIHLYVFKTGSPLSNLVDGLLTGIKLGDPSHPFISVGIRSGYLAMVINQLPAFLGVYAVGLIGSLIYVLCAKRLKRVWWVGLIFTILTIVFCYLVVRVVTECASLDAELAQMWQIRERLKLSLIFMGLILSAAFASKPVRWLFSNKLMVFLSTISYNLYIWHQWLCVKLKNDWRIPFWEGDKPPNQLNTSAAKVWKTEYAIIITAAAFIAAILVTYLYERPMSDMLNERKTIYNGKLKDKLNKKRTAD